VHGICARWGVEADGGRLDKETAMTRRAVVRRPSSGVGGGDVIRRSSLAIRRRRISCGGEGLDGG